MAKNGTAKPYQTAGYPSVDASLEPGYPDEASKCFDDDGRTKRTGNVWTASSHIITAVIGSGVLSLAWAIAQLGWVAGPAAMMLFSFVTYYTSSLLSDCYRCGDPAPESGTTATWTPSVRTSVSSTVVASGLTNIRNLTCSLPDLNYLLGGFKVKICGLIQYLNLFGVAIGYTIAASISMLAIERSNCFHKNGHEDPCKSSGTPYMIIFGVAQFFLSQIPDFDQISWLSIVAAVMSFTYSIIGLTLGIMQVIANGGFKGNLTGVNIGPITEAQKIWRSLHAFGDIAFAYSYSLILIEIEDTIRTPPPSEAKVMKKATLFSVSLTTVFYMLCGCMGYAAFGDAAPGNLLTGFGFYNPFWLLDIANAAIVIHLVGAYQVFCQPLFAFIEKFAERTWPNAPIITREVRVTKFLTLNVFRLGWRSAFVVLTTIIAMMMPFFNDVVGFLGALGFWPLTVYFPVEMYIVQKRVPKWSSKWVCLQMLSVGCLMITIAAAAGSIAGVVGDLKTYKPFQS